MAQEKIEKIREIVAPLLVSMGLELVDLELSGSAKQSRLRIFIDKAGGVTVDDCEQASRYIGYALDTADPISGTYTLELSSPGLDRPLRKVEDYRRYTGKLVRLKMARPLLGAWTIVGRFQSIDMDRMKIQPAEGEPIEVALADVNQARLEVEW